MNCQSVIFNESSRFERLVRDGDAPQQKLYIPMVGLDGTDFIAVGFPTSLFDTSTLGFLRWGMDDELTATVSEGVE